MPARTGRGGRGGRGAAKKQNRYRRVRRKVCNFCVERIDEIPVELTDRESLFRRPLHPYTVSLLSAVPIPDPASERRRKRIVLGGELAQLSGEPHGCRFQPRCPVGRDRDVCRRQEPPLVEHVPGQWAACHFPGELAASLGESEPAK